VAGLRNTLASATRRWVRKRDFYAGILVIALGLVAAVNGPRYHIGTLVQAGPGLMPTALGVLLIILGIIIAGSALATPPGEDEDILPENPQWLGWILILAGPVAFVILGKIGGLIPATFGCVFISAWGDREATLKSSFVLAFVITVFSIVLFSYVLRVPMPLLTWGMS
jgi:hypothetical protein